MSSIVRSISVIGCLAAMVAVAGCAGMSTGSNNSAGINSNMQQGVMGGAAAGQPGRTGQRDLGSLQSWAIRTTHFGGVAPTPADLAGDTSELLIVSPSDLTTPKDSSLAKQVSFTRGKNAKRILALVNVASLDPSDSSWDKSWAADSSGKLSATAPSWLESPSLADKDKSARADSHTDTPPANQKDVDGSYRVRYWDPDWEKRLKTEVAALHKAGFDGVCIDGVEKFTAMQTERPTAAADMATLVADLAQAERAKSPDFLIVPIDNGRLIDKLTDEQRAPYLATVDGVVAESVFYNGSKAYDNDLNPQPDLIPALNRYHSAHKVVLVADFLTAAAKTADFQARAKTNGYLPYIVQPPKPATPLTSPTSVAQTSI